MIIAAVVLVGMQLFPGKTAAEQACADRPISVNLFFQTDEQMHAVAGKIRADRRLTRMEPATRAEGYERFKVEFKDQPDVVEGIRPDAIPPSIRASVTDDEANPLATELQARYPEITRAIVNRCQSTKYPRGDSFTAPSSR
ncbi:hypothetical protein D5S17_04245 [Pseudonocardiaceae bacterium YIM PH 21723]|nr:hypothetical protein D5S17_04245 [Pseudonocardiaceae bacterium YIM PH 21723]